MSGIALMLDGVVDAIDRGASTTRRRSSARAVSRQRETIRELRDLSFALEPVVLRDQGFGQPCRRSPTRSSFRRASSWTSTSTPMRWRAGPRSCSTRSSASPSTPPCGGAADPHLRGDRRGGRWSVETLITDDGSGERRRRVFEALAERARTLGGTVDVDRSSDEGGTAVRITLPPYTARG